ncbi:MAG: PfkB family carbohydrate kinase [Dehalococcoidia bacterium]
MASPDLVVVGHVVRDVTREGWRLGGTASFGAAQAQKLGLRVGVVTRVGPDLEMAGIMPKIEIAGRPAARTTTFENTYEGATRRQRVAAQAEPIEEQDIPDAWRDAPMALIGPVCREVSPELPGVFANALVGIAAQGWLRELDAEGHVRRSQWTGPPFWSSCRLLFVSDEDVGDRPEQIDRWAADVPVTVVTRERRGARIHEHGRWRAIDAIPAREVDPTGAGDIFATAFMVRYHETGDAAQAARFASSAAAWSVEAPGIDGVAGRAGIEARMMEHPEVVLR